MTHPRRSAVATLAALALLAGACTSKKTDSVPTPNPAGQMQAIFANYEAITGAPNRIEVGLVRADNSSLSYGTVQFHFSFIGTEANPTAPQPGPSATAKFLLVPGMQASGQSQPSFTQPTVARGVYEAEGVKFDRAGFWAVDVSARLADGTSQTATTKFAVTDTPAYPAPGQKAPRTQNLTLSSKNVPASAIDSRALTGGKGAIPDPELHTTTIADAIAAHHPVFVLFSTPVYCMSKFCGPVTDAVDQLAKHYADRADFVHVEIYKSYTAKKKVINQAAADWVYRNGDLTEPWLFYVGSDGVIEDRWQNLVDLQEVAQVLQKLPVLH
ncbi:MAG: hypothetical protein M3O88_07190 [Actinomycetota bacterium]|nr:hypothetical protein [Actinomycetota bacterium]